MKNVILLLCLVLTAHLTLGQEEMDRAEKKFNKAEEKLKKEKEKQADPKRFEGTKFETFEGLAKEVKGDREFKASKMSKKDIAKVVKLEVAVPLDYTIKRVAGWEKLPDEPRWDECNIYVEGEMLWGENISCSDGSKFLDRPKIKKLEAEKRWLVTWEYSNKNPDKKKKAKIVVWTRKD